MTRQTKKFKTCPSCEKLWPTRQQFIDDPRLKLIGYQVNFKELKTGLFLFNHSCGTTMSLKVEKFVDLYDGPVFTERKTGSDQCLGLCLHRSELRPCPAKCECAFVREIIQILKSDEDKVKI